MFGKFVKKFIDFKSTDPRVNQRSKNLVSYGILGIVMLIIVIVVSSYQSNRNKKIKINNAGNAKNKVEIASSLNVKAEDEWISKSESDLKTLQEQNKTLLQRLEMLEKQQKESQESYGRTIDSLAGELTSTRMQITENQNIGNDGQQFNEYGELINRYERNNIMRVTIDLEGNMEVETIGQNDLSDYIPIGSQVKAIMISSADVSTGQFSQSDPNNMLFEVTGPVYGPKFKGREQKNRKLDGCIISGSAVGHVATQKAYIRLLKMSCSLQAGKTTEYTVKGYVTSFAKEGVRGTLVSQSSYFAGMGFLAGAVENISKTISTSYSPTVEITSGIATENLSASNLAKQGAFGGIGKSGEIMVDYFLKIADQFYPIVDLPTGIEVEIVFQEGINLSTKTGFKLKTNELGKQVGTQIGADANVNDSRSNIYTNNNNGVF